jgi:hypothetical protein
LGSQIILKSWGVRKPKGLYIDFLEHFTKLPKHTYTKKFKKFKISKISKNLKFQKNSKFYNKKNFKVQNFKIFTKF